MAGHQPILLKAQIRDVVFGVNVKVLEPVNLFECRIGDNCLVGPFVEIQKNTVIGNRTRIQSHTFICESVTIGEDCFIAHGVMFVDDMFSDGGPSHGDRSKWKKIKIGNRVSIGSNATILAGFVCDDVVIGAGAVVTKDITLPGIYAGNPARFLRAFPKKEEQVKENGA
ncbi:MAG TPA: acyltransferase [Chitinophagaceae bacterium]|jgi:acetyltransferase-like isoleucine patch superfamily enzyme|nr:acyltransferase [Chitinophagaceae bacterium]